MWRRTEMSCGAFCASTVRMSVSRKERMSNHPLQTRYPEKRETPIAQLPAKHFINLTNGIEAIRVVKEKLQVPEPMYLRLQSSLCEQAAYDKIIMETDNNFLAHLATGHTCYVYDLASRSKRYGVPRAIWYGLEFIRFACAWAWYGEDSELLPKQVLLRGKNVVGTWNNVMKHEVSKPVRQKLKYYREYVAELGVTEVRAFGVVGAPTDLDGCKEIYAKMVRDSYENGAHENPAPGDEEFLARLERNGLRIFRHDATFEENFLATESLRTGRGPS